MKGRQFYSRSGHKLGSQLRSRSGCVQAATNQCFSLTSVFLSLSFFPPYPPPLKRKLKTEKEKKKPKGFRGCKATTIVKALGGVRGLNTRLRTDNPETNISAWGAARWVRWGDTAQSYHVLGTLWCQCKPVNQGALDSLGQKTGGSRGPNSSLSSICIFCITKEGAGSWGAGSLAENKQGINYFHIFAKYLCV